MPKLIISEKNSVAKSIAAAIGAKSQKGSFYEGNGFVVSWCIGHLLGLAEPQAYDGKYSKWRYEDLPIIPAKWRHIPTPATQNQLTVLVNLIHRTDITAIVNACDAGREGELIFRLVYNHAKTKKPTERLWISSMEESAIKEGFAKLKSGNDYNLLYHAALCRQCADWAVGMNGSRLFSVLYGDSLRVGRVQTPTLAMLTERHKKIAEFVSEPFFVVELREHNSPNGSVAGFVAERERLPEKQQADLISEKCNGKIASIKSLKNQRKTAAAPKLYDLTTLQREANRLFGYTAEQTLATAQKLYESKFLTYPRTDSRFLSDDLEKDVAALVIALPQILPFALPSSQSLKINTKQVINKKKVTDHHAIIPTASAPKINLQAISQQEQNIFTLVSTRLISAVCGKHIYDETSVVAVCEGENFKAKGKTILENGWKSVEQAMVVGLGRMLKGEMPPLPPLTEGQQFTAATAVREGATQPPKPYTEDTLLSAMENAGSEDMPAEMERKGLGTPATRAAIIENLVKSGFAVREKKNLSATEKGINLIKILPETVKSPKLTAEWEHSLKSVERGEISAKEFMDAIKVYVAEMVRDNPPSGVSVENRGMFAGNFGGKNGNFQNGKNAKKGKKASGDILGKCPRCQNDVAENSKAFSCVNRDCNFALFKDNKFFGAIGKKMTKSVAKKLLAGDKLKLVGCVAKSGKKYDALVFLEGENAGNVGFPRFGMEFLKEDEGK
ncbi:MAG: DNA topoisomerase 3 [Firmicutes bacterium]|nr:DNA topoisomerase 3 [Bacillota bacterium]